MPEKFIVLDTETTIDFDTPLCYDLGFAVVDKAGNVYESHSFVIAEIFLDEELMASAYFIDKVQTYWKEIKAGQRKLVRFSTARWTLIDTMKKYDIKIVMAHNARFDYRAVNCTQRMVADPKWQYFFPFGTEIWDTLKMAREAFGKDEEYITFCSEHQLQTSNGKTSFTAENIYRYLINDATFEESHTGLEDVLIEKEIFAECVRRGITEGKLW